MKSLFFFLLLSTSILSHKESAPPNWFTKSFNQLKLDQKYEVNEFLKPTYFIKDFNGDGIEDIAITIIEKRTKKKGILVMHGGSNQYFILGAGTAFGNGGNDFKWAKGWNIYKGKIAYEQLFNKDGDILGSKKIRLARATFFIYDLEEGEPNSGGIFYWNGKKYIWIHQGE